MRIKCGYHVISSSFFFRWSLQRRSWILTWMSTLWWPTCPSSPNLNWSPAPPWGPRHCTRRGPKLTDQVRGNSESKSVQRLINLNLMLSASSENQLPAAGCVGVCVCLFVSLLLCDVKNLIGLFVSQVSNLAVTLSWNQQSFWWRQWRLDWEKFWFMLRIQRDTQRRWEHTLLFYI